MLLTVVRGEVVHGETGFLSLDNDPRETTNLADAPAHAVTVVDLKARLAAYRR